MLRTVVGLVVKWNVFAFIRRYVELNTVAVLL